MPLWKGVIWIVAAGLIGTSGFGYSIISETNRHAEIKKRVRAQYEHIFSDDLFIHTFRYLSENPDLTRNIERCEILRPPSKRPTMYCSEIRPHESGREIPLRTYQKELTPEELGALEEIAEGK